MTLLTFNRVASARLDREQYILSFIFSYFYEICHLVF